MGAGSAQEFREDFLVPAFKQALEQQDRLNVDLTGCAGFSWPWLEETFGGLARDVYKLPGAGKVYLVIECLDDSEIIDKAWEFLYNSYQSLNAIQR